MGTCCTSRSIGTKVTSDNEADLAAAEAQGKVPSESARKLLLRGAVIALKESLNGKSLANW